MHAVKLCYCCPTCPEGISSFLRSTFDTSILTILLNCNLNETCMHNQGGSLLSNLWKCMKKACVSCRVHLHLSRYSSKLGNWLLIAAINIWWLSASNSCSISAVQFDVTTHSFPRRWLAVPVKIVLFLMISAQYKEGVVASEGHCNWHLCLIDILCGEQ